MKTKLFLKIFNLFNDISICKAIKNRFNILKVYSQNRFQPLTGYFYQNVMKNKRCIVQKDPFEC